MPAAGGIKKSELYIDTPVKLKRPAVIQGNPLEPYVRPVSPFLKVLSYVGLWENPALSAYTFIWLNVCILLHAVFGSSLLLSTTVSVLLLILNTILVEETFTHSNLVIGILCGLMDVNSERLDTLPGSTEFSQMMVNTANSVCNVFLNIRDSSKQGQTQFSLALCTTVAMVTIVLSYLASSTTLLILFWFLFCYPAIKHNELHKKITQEQIIATFNMSMYMFYNLYLAVLQAVSSAPPQADIQEIDNDGVTETIPSAGLTEPGASLRSTTMSYFRGLPSVMTLNWRTWRALPAAAPTAPSPITESTESDSDFGIEDIDEDVAAANAPMDTLGSSAGLVFPTIDREEEPGTLTLAAEQLDPQLLFDEDKSFSLDSMGASEFTLGGAQRLNLLDAVTETSDSDLETDGRLADFSPEFGSSIVSAPMSRDDTLDGKQLMLDVTPRPPAGPKPADSGSTLRRRIKQPSDASAATTDTEFYVISDEDIRAAEDDISREEGSESGSVGSLREMISGRIKRLSHGESSNPAV